MAGIITGIRKVISTGEVTITVITSTDRTLAGDIMITAITMTGETTDGVIAGGITAIDRRTGPFYTGTSIAAGWHCNFSIERLCYL